MYLAKQLFRINQMSETHIFTSKSVSSWSEVLKKLPKHLQDSYYNWEYANLYEVSERTSAMLFVYSASENLYINCFLKHKITSIKGQSLAKPIYDIETPYGYGGPLSTTQNEKFIADANSVFLDWARESQITAEFVRFHPILRTNVFAGSEMHISKDRTTYSVKLDSDISALEHFKGTARNRIKGALKYGIRAIEIPIEQGIPLFKSLYLDSMKRLKADDYYRFTDEYFVRLGSMPHDKLKLLASYDDLGILSSAIFLVDQNAMHYHLGANSERKAHSGSFNLLIYHAVSMGLTQNLKWVHVGGGRSSDGSDSLSQFKRTITNSSHDYFIGRRIHNLETWQAAQALLFSDRHSQENEGKLLEYHFHP
jgi:hypothetical protein